MTATMSWPPLWHHRHYGMTATMALPPLWHDRHYVMTPTMAWPPLRHDRHYGLTATMAWHQLSHDRQDDMTAAMAWLSLWHDRHYVMIICSCYYNSILDTNQLSTWRSYLRSFRRQVAQCGQRWDAAHGVWMLQLTASGCCSMLRTGAAPPGAWEVYHTWSVGAATSGVQLLHHADCGCCNTWCGSAYTPVCGCYNMWRVSAATRGV